MSGWTIFTICFTTLLVGTWLALTILEFYRADRKMREVDVPGAAPRAAVRRRGAEVDL